MATISIPIEAVRQMDREKARYAALGVCAPCSYSLSRAGVTGNPVLCNECEGVDLGSKD
jgi:hypothetical protein